MKRGAPPQRFKLKGCSSLVLSYFQKLNGDTMREKLHVTKFALLCRRGELPIKELAAIHAGFYIQNFVRGALQWTFLHCGMEQSRYKFTTSVKTWLFGKGRSR